MKLKSARQLHLISTMAEPISLKLWSRARPDIPGLMVICGMAPWCLLRLIDELRGIVSVLICSFFVFWISFVVGGWLPFAVCFTISYYLVSVAVS